MPKLPVFGIQENTCFVVLVRGHRNLARRWVHHRLELAGLQSFHGGLLIGLAHVDHERTVAGHVDPEVQNGKQQNSQSHQDDGHGFLNTRLLQHLLNTCQGASTKVAAIAAVATNLLVDVHAWCKGCQSATATTIAVGITRGGQGIAACVAGR